MNPFQFWWGGHHIRCTIDAGPLVAGVPAITRNATWRLHIDEEDVGIIAPFNVLEPLDSVIDVAIRNLRTRVGPGLVDEPIGPLDLGEQYGEEFLVVADGKKYFVVFVLGPDQSMAVPLDWQPGKEPPIEQHWMARVYPPGRPDLARTVSVDEALIQRQPTKADLEAIVVSAWH